MDELRAKCPWDMKQTNESLRKLTIEEVYELGDAILNANAGEIKKELGDILLHIVFYAKIGSADLIVISFAEHNGNFSAAFKNVLDWMSRINAKTFQEKEMLLLATSPGARGGSSVLDIATKRFPFQGGIVKGSFSLPSFYENFDVVNGIINPEYKKQLLEIIKSI
jgi:NTP pyrophosphatase (non-canonical NTP hydrolase)